MMQEDREKDKRTFKSLFLIICLIAMIFFCLSLLFLSIHMMSSSIILGLLTFGLFVLLGLGGVLVMSYSLVKFLKEYENCL
jgi:lipopolysaccharide export LptBFGC system permease protein LptF